MPSSPGSSEGLSGARPAVSRRQAGSRRAAREGRGRWTPVWFLGPALLVYAAFWLWPLGRAAQFSLFSWDAVSPARFVGLDNFRAMLADEVLLGSFWHAGALIVLYTFGPIAAGLVLASIMARSRSRGVGLVRTVLFLPQVIAMAVVAVAWNRVYASDGPINRALEAVGLGGLARPWLGDHQTALPAVGVIGAWAQTGLVTVLLLAGVARIPRERFEAARLDGAGPLAEFFAVTLPGVRAEIVVSATLTVIAALKNFDLVYLTTSGGPGDSTSVPSYQVFNQAFRLGQVGMAAAIGVTLALIILVVNLVLNRVAAPAGER